MPPATAGRIERDPLIANPEFVPHVERKARAIFDVNQPDRHAGRNAAGPCQRRQEHGMLRACAFASLGDFDAPLKMP